MRGAFLDQAVTALQSHRAHIDDMKSEIETAVLGGTEFNNTAPALNRIANGVLDCKGSIHLVGTFGDEDPFPLALKQAVGDMLQSVIDCTNALLSVEQTKPR